MLNVVKNHDQERAAAEQHARRHLLDAGASAVPRAPWLHPGQPLSSIDLIRYAVWRGSGDQGDQGDRGDQVTEEDVQAALALLPAARAEIDQLEAALLFTARSRGLPWSRISRAMGLGSAQAALQRFDRITSRIGPHEDRTP